MPTGINIPGTTSMAQVEKLLFNLERSIGLSDVKQVSGEMYWATLRELILSVPANQASKMDPEEEAAYLSRVIGCDKETFVSRIDAKLKQRAREIARENVGKRKLAGKSKL